MVKRVDIALAVSKKAEDDESSKILYEGGFIGESGKFYPFEIGWSYRWLYEEMRSRALCRILESQYYDRIDKSCYTPKSDKSNSEIIYKESIFINE